MWNKIEKTKLIRCVIILGGAAVFILLIGIGNVLLFQDDDKPKTTEKTTQTEELHRVPKMEFDVRLLEPNRYSRPQIKLKKVNAVVVHYTSNPGTDAVDNRNYFNNLPQINETRSKPVFASSHFVIGLSGQMVQCIPLSEMAYASNSRNSDTIAIECCHPGKSGKFNSKTYHSLLKLLAYLCLRYKLDPEQDIIRHYDVTGKLCPKYYVKHVDAWEKLLSDAVTETKKEEKALQKTGAEYDLADENGKIKD